MRFRDRVSELQSELRDREADAAALYPGPNTHYLAGIFGEPLDRHLLLVVPSESDPYFVTPEKSVDLINDESWVDAGRVIEANDEAAVGEATVAELDADRLLLDGRAPYALAGPLERAFDGTVDAAEPAMAALRITKDDDEIERLQKSAAVADEVSKEIRALGPHAVGMTEAELADEIRGLLAAKGNTRYSFPPVVASGPNAARPYVRNSDRRIKEGEPVILDFGGFVDEYASDQTRTVVFAGDPPEGFEEVYDVVREAQNAGVAAVEPGVTAGEVHEATYEVVHERGYGEQIIHGTGHGVGLEAHEAPGVGEGAETVLEEGMVFSVEPGVYLEGEWGVRIEDLVVVTAEGCERLNHSPRGWHPL
jgi:Xaa-Pro aminopeptidase